MLDWLTEHLDQPVDAATLAAKACMSERSFRRHFEAEMGVPLRRYLTQARITKALTLLESTRLPVTAIARQCGFSSAEAMRYAFTAELDVTPSVYRERFG